MSNKSKKKVAPVPAGYRTLTPHLAVADADAAIDFYREAFGAKVLAEARNPADESVLYARLKIGNTMLTLSHVRQEDGLYAPSAFAASGVTMHLYLEDLDATFEAAIKAGATVLVPIFQAYWGDRMGVVLDPFGHRWSLATRVEKLTDEEIAARTLEIYAPKPAEEDIKREAIQPHDVADVAVLGALSTQVAAEGKIGLGEQVA